MSAEMSLMVPDRIANILKQYANDIRELYGEDLDSVILFGSYARGDYTEESDIDIMIMVNISEVEAKRYFDKLNKITYDYDLDNDIMLMPIVKNKEHFLEWVGCYPFYNSIDREGIKIYESV